ncbi:hypothetical protein C4K00_2113 [Pseudomonas synxantha]|uniref:hypothetical protein n=1 Tax=Pseudomonas synxantha TaxID=47883 RepID=UPI000F57CE55|nr:hypothetical protein [Pseudomonas synxantha]AZE72342.1 hypothetical protein C4K00_2113 [Pseudomonas synxantha]AZE78009.1 hypothetical protein C4J99_2224 [Pseudomonas synxantha]
MSISFTGSVSFTRMVGLLASGLEKGTGESKVSTKFLRAHVKLSENCAQKALKTPGKAIYAEDASSIKRSLSLLSEKLLGQGSKILEYKMDMINKIAYNFSVAQKGRVN